MLIFYIELIFYTISEPVVSLRAVRARHIRSTNRGGPRAAHAYKPTVFTNGPYTPIRTARHKSVSLVYTSSGDLTTIGLSLICTSYELDRVYN